MKWQGVDLKNLLTKNIDELIELYPEQTKQNLIRRKQEACKKEKIIVSEMERQVNENDPPKDLTAFERLLDRSGVKAEDVAEISKMKIWQTSKGGEDGEWDQIDNHSMVIKPKQKAPEEGSFPFLSEAAPTKITPSRARRLGGDTLVVAGVPDLQWGYRELEQGKYYELHDPEAVDLGLQLLRYIKPDQIKLGGDELDAGQLGRWDKDSRHQISTLQMSIDGLHRFMSQLRSDHPDADIENLTSNHVKRFGDYMLKNAFELFGIRPANMPKKWPSLSYPSLMRLDELGIKYQEGGYPAGMTMITPELGTFHGDKSNQYSTAAEYIKKYDFSVWFYHDHRYSVASKVFPSGKQTVAFGSGNWTRTDGAVPGYGTSVGDKGEIGHQQMNWTQGMTVVYVDKKSQKFRHVHIPFHRDENNLPWAEFENKIFKATPGGFSGLERPDMHIDWKPDGNE
jgi:hypothetical protein